VGSVILLRANFSNHAHFDRLFERPPALPVQSIYFLLKHAKLSHSSSFLSPVSREGVPFSLSSVLLSTGEVLGAARRFFFFETLENLPLYMYSSIKAAPFKFSTFFFAQNKIGNSFVMYLYKCTVNVYTKRDENRVMNNELKIV
jgi:hypothetical protein